MPQSKKPKEKMVPGEMTGKMYPLSEMRKRQRQESITLNGVKEDMRRAAANAAKKPSPMMKSINAMAMSQAPARIAFMKKMAQNKKKK